MTKYDFVPDKEDKTLECIKIMDGKYEGMVYQYGTVGFEEVEDEDSAELVFNYRVIDEVENSDPNELQEILGDILVEILDEHVEDLTNRDFKVNNDEVEGNPVLRSQIEGELKKAEMSRND
tara:strand:- start:323 stop:685 length:363 start_codon:yes stop_codon:yes gene_type:complete